jgi:hypothetical protein
MTRPLARAPASLAPATGERELVVVKLGGSVGRERPLERKPFGTWNSL